MYRSWKNLCLGLLISIILFGIQNVNGENYYLVNAAPSLFSGQAYGVIVTIFQSKKSSSCRVSLSGPNLDMKMIYNLTPQDPCRSYQFKLPKLKPGNYTLTVEGIRGQYFKTSSPITWGAIKLFVKIQTPKMNYKPGELLRFRVIFFNEHLKPQQPRSNSYIQISDGKDNVVGKYRQLKIKNGVFRGRFQLADHPVLGRWSICTMSANKVKEQCAYINVLEYVHSPFKVTLQMKRIVALTDKTLSVTVQSKYASENTIESNCILIAKTYPNEKNSSYKSIKVKQKKKIKSGKSVFTIDLTRFSKQIPNIKPLRIYFTAMVMDDHTSDWGNATTVINLYASPYVIECVDTKGYCTKIIAHTENSLSFRITNIDGRLVNAKNTVNLIYTSSSSKIHTFTSQLGESGVVIFPKVKISAKNTGNTSSIIFKTEIVFQGVRQSLQDTTLNFISIRALKNKIQTRTSKISARSGTSEYITFDLNHKFSICTCVVMANGNVRSGYSITPDVFNRIDVKIDITNDMWPSVNVFIFGVEGNTLFMIEKTISLNADRNTISIETSETVTPGEEASFMISTSPQSYVFLMATDVSVLRLKDNINDFDFSELDSLWNNQSKGTKPDMDLPSKHLGLVRLTNAPVVKNEINKEATLQSKMKLATTRNSKKTSIRPKFGTESNNDIRRNFTDIWIFDMLRSSTIGWDYFYYDVPDSITTWRLNAFSMHSQRGLSVLSTPIYIRSTKKLYLTTTLPRSIKKDEVLRIPITCFNQATRNYLIVINFNYDPKKLQLVNKNHDEIPNVDVVRYLNESDFFVAFYFIKPLQIGTLELTFTAMVTISPIMDNIRHRLNVVGTEQVGKRSIAYIDSKHNKLSVNKIPLNHMGIEQRTAKYVKCQVTNQIIALSLQNLPDFHPFDNGEELISKLFSCLYLWDYMKSQQLLNNTLRQRFQKCFNNGFQSLFRFKRPDGGFAFYAQLDPVKSSCSSTWLSGYALKALQMLQKVKYLKDDNILLQVENFLMNRRKGNIIYKEPCKTPTRSTLSNFELTQEIFEVLESSLNRKDVLATLKWLNHQSKFKELNKPINRNSSHSWLNARKELAMAGSALLHNSLSLSKQFELFRLVVDKLYGQYIHPNSYESILAVQGIYEYIKRNPSKLNKLSVEIYDGSQTIKLNFNQPKDLTIHQIVVANSIQFDINGTGQVILQCGSLYNDVNSSQSKPKRYKLKVIQKKYKQNLELRLCLVRFAEQSEDYVGTILEFGLPTGYVLSSEKLEKLQRNDIVKQAMLLNDNTKLYVEFKPLPSNKWQCVRNQAKLLHKLYNLQPVNVMVYDANTKMEADVFTYKVSDAKKKYK